jgi:nicotinamide-nucleotide amidase
MNIEVINTGSELMLGQVLNSHLGYFSQHLLPLGLRISRQHTLPDGSIIKNVLSEALTRADLILLTGGLGPTSDDLTRDLVSELCQAPLEYHPPLAAKIHDFFARRNITPPDSVNVQAYLPQRAHIFENNHGTAPGFRLTHQNKQIICLPGPPSELYPMFEEQVLPYINSLQPHAIPLHSLQFRIYGLGESEVQERIEKKLLTLGPVEIGYCARHREIDLRLISSSSDLLQTMSNTVHETFGDFIYALGNDPMEATVVRLATQLKLKITTAESCTGGLTAHRLTNIPGSSAVFDGGWITYSDAVKIKELGVQSETLRQHGAVSAQTAEEMARAALSKSGADLAVSLTGIAGPGGGSEAKPVGTLFIALAEKSPSGSISCQIQQKQLVPRRELFKFGASQSALDLIRRALLKRT